MRFLLLSGYVVKVLVLVLWAADVSPPPTLFVIVSRQCKGATQFGFLPSVRLFEERALELPFQPDAKTEQGSEIRVRDARGLGLAAGPLLSHWDFRAHSGSTTW